MAAGRDGESHGSGNMSGGKSRGTAWMSSAPHQHRSRATNLLAAALLIGLLLTANPARAELVLGFGQPGYVAGACQGMDVSVFLTESGTSILATEGLNSAGLVVSFNLPT